MDKTESYSVKYNKSDFLERMDPFFYHPTFQNLPFKEEMLSKISDVVKVISRKPEPGKKYKYVEISSVDSNTYKIDHPDDLEEYNYEDLPTRARKVIRKGDILFSKMVENPLVTIVEQEHDGCVATNAFIVIKPKIDISPELFTYLLRLGPVKKQYKRYSYGLITQITNRDFEKVKVPIPRDNILKEIEYEMKSYKKVRDEVIRQYRNLVQDINDKFLKMLDINQIENPTVNSFIVKGNKIDADKLHPSFYSPEYTIILDLIEAYSGEIVFLEDIIKEVTIGYPISPTKNGGRKYISSSNIKPLHIDLAECKQTEDDTSLPTLNLNDLVVVSSGYSLGTVALVKESSVGYSFNNHIYKLNVCDEIDPNYLMIYLNSSLGKKQFERYAGGIAQKNINSKDILKLVVIIPSKDLQEKISSSILDYYCKVNNKYLELKEDEQRLEQKVIAILS
ncbi:MAG: restriction endonuclease subunit S [bacterium]